MNRNPTVRTSTAATALATMKLETSTPRSRAREATQMVVASQRARKRAEKASTGKPGRRIRSR